MKRRLNKEDVEVIGEDELTRLIKHRFHGDPSEAIRRWADDSNANKFRDELARIAAECDDVLKSHSFPAAIERVGISPEGNRLPIAKAIDPITGKVRKGFRTPKGARYVLERSPIFSEEWYAAAIGELCEELDGASDPSDSVYQVNILQLGHLITDRYWRLKYKRSILRGARVRKGAQDGGAARANRLAELTGQSASAVSQHLAKLRAAGLVESRREGQTIYYRSNGGIGHAVVDTLCDYFR
ncbi:MAG: metalloregulator ArsR/SmtB family transcription factor [Hyphomonas sp.]|uniref:ArsR/SmtB family transcription factor n=1 Tax=Hyphomonas sp. TaxID=87 RepID=UPI003002FE1A